RSVEPGEHGDRFRIAGDRLATAVTENEGEYARKNGREALHQTAPKSLYPLLYTLTPPTQAPAAPDPPASARVVGRVFVDVPLGQITAIRGGRRRAYAKGDDDVHRFILQGRAHGLVVE